ncbi:PspC domain-containing protein [Aerococcus vaginalis]
MKRSSTNRRIAGVFGGLADSLNMSATVLRLIAFIVLFTPMALPVVFLYFVFAFLLPAESTAARKQKRTTVYYTGSQDHSRGRRTAIREAEHVEDD